MAKAGYWRDRAEFVIRQVFEGLPEGVPLADRVAAVDAAYPFGERRFTPYKVWLKARAKALIPFGHVPKNAAKLPLFEGVSPLERAKKRSENIAQHRGRG